MKKDSITIMDGRELKCFPKPTAGPVFSADILELDSTGQYLSIGNGRPSSITPDSASEERDFFVSNAWFFLENAERILSDSRMFLAPVTITNGLAYTGTSGFRNPTLGIYLEWWLGNRESVTKDNEGSEALMVSFSGSGLSGMNHCYCVYPDGSTCSFCHRSFKDVWNSFNKINSRYTEAKEKSESFSLKEVYDILTAYSSGEKNGLERKIEILDIRHSRLEKSFQSLLDRFQEVCLQSHAQELVSLEKEQEARGCEIRSRIAELDSLRKKYRESWERGALSQADYCRLVGPVSQERKRLEEELDSFLKRSTAIIMDDNWRFASSLIENLNM